MTVSHLILLACFDSDGLASVFNSPFIVPVFGTMMILGIVVAGIWSGVRTREMQSQERLAAIAKGLPLEAAWNQIAVGTPTQHAAGGMVSGRNDGSSARRAGIILISIGLGVGSFFCVLEAVLQVKYIFIPAATGFIPLFIGLGFLLDGAFRRSEYRRALEASGAGQPASSRLGTL